MYADVVIDLDERRNLLEAQEGYDQSCAASRLHFPRSIQVEVDLVLPMLHVFGGTSTSALIAQTGSVLGLWYLLV